MPVTLDDAFPPTVQVIDTHVRSVALDVRSAPDVSWLAIEVTAPAGEALAVPVDLPAGTLVVGMTVSHDGVARLAAPLAWQHALARAHAGVDPATATWVGESAGEAHLALEVRGSATIELALALPALARLRIAAGRARVTARVAGAAATTGAARAAALELDLGAIKSAPPVDAAVDATTTLFTDDGVERRAVPTVRLGVIDRGWEGDGGDLRTYRRTIRWHTAQLRRCFMAEAQRDPQIGTTAELQFLVEADGSVSHAVASGSVPVAVAACLAAEAARWTFGESRGATQIHYPLTFQLR